MANRGPNSNSSQVRVRPFHLHAWSSVVFSYGAPSLRAFAKTCLAFPLTLSQFFITTAPAPWCDFKNVVFGELSSGISPLRPPPLRSILYSTDVWHPSDIHRRSY